jgi:hypothetical protein
LDLTKESQLNSNFLKNNNKEKKNTTYYECFNKLVIFYSTIVNDRDRGLWWVLMALVITLKRREKIKEKG